MNQETLLVIVFALFGVVAGLVVDKHNKSGVFKSNSPFPGQQICVVPKQVLQYGKGQEKQMAKYMWDNMVCEK